MTPSLVLCEALLERFLRVQSDQRSCLPRLAKMLNASLEDVRVAAERLSVIPGLTAGARQCSNCYELRAALGFIVD